MRSNCRQGTCAGQPVPSAGAVFLYQGGKWKRWDAGGSAGAGLGAAMCPGSCAVPSARERWFAAQPCAGNAPAVHSQCVNP